MELFEFISVMAVVILAGFVITRYITMKENAARWKATKDAQISAQNRKAAQSKKKPETVRGGGPDLEEGDAVAPWVADLLSGFGIDPEVIFEDEMPEDLKRFLPFAKSYVSAQGGLPGIAKQIQDGQQGPPGEQDGAGL